MEQPQLRVVSAKLATGATEQARKLNAQSTRTLCQVPLCVPHVRELRCPLQALPPPALAWSAAMLNEEAVKVVMMETRYQETAARPLASSKRATHVVAVVLQPKTPVLVAHLGTTAQEGFRPFALQAHGLTSKL